MIRSAANLFRARWLAVLCLILPTLSFGATPVANEYVIRGLLQGGADGTKVELALTAGKPIASTTVQDGKFAFAGSVRYPALYTVTFHVNPPDKEVPARTYQPDIAVFLENSPIAISAVASELPKDFREAYTGRPAHLRAIVKGSATHDLYMQYMKGYQPLEDERSRIFVDDYVAYLNPGKDKKIGPAAEGIAIVDRIDAATAKRDAYTREFIRAHKDDFVGAYVAQSSFPRFSVQEIDTLLAAFSPRIRSSAAWGELKAAADDARLTASGAPFVDFAFNDSDGNPVKLSDHVGKGKYVLVEFWASWCGPCRADIPHLKEVYDLYHPAGFEVISVSMDSDKAAWLKAVGEEKMKWLQVSDLKAFEGELSKTYNFNGIPTCVLMAPDGKIVTRNMRGSWMDRKLIELYGNKFVDAASHLD